MVSLGFPLLICSFVFRIHAPEAILIRFSVRRPKLMLESGFLLFAASLCGIRCLPLQHALPTFLALKECWILVYPIGCMRLCKFLIAVCLTLSIQRTFDCISNCWNPAVRYKQSLSYMTFTLEGALFQSLVNWNLSQRNFECGLARLKTIGFPQYPPPIPYAVLATDTMCGTQPGKRTR